MGGDKEAHDRSLWGEWHHQTIVEIANGSAFRMGYLGVRGQLEACLDLWQIKPAILFAPPNGPTLAREDLFHRGFVSIQSIDTDDDLREGKRKRRRVGRDGLEGLSQFFSVVAVSWARKGANPLMRVRLQNRRPGSPHLSSFACEIAFRAHLIKTTVRGRMVSCLGKCPLSCCLFGPIDIDQEPAISQTIPESAWRRAERGSGHQILLKEE